MEEDKNVPEEETKTAWQARKESWYEKVPLSVKQLDIIIWGCGIALILVFVKIFIDSGIFG